MSARDLIQEALHSLEANKGRSLLTILGIVIGIASVIAMTSLIGGIQNTLVNSLGLNAARMVQIYSSQELTESDIEKLQKLVPQIEQIGIVDSAYTEYKTGDKSYTVMAQGVDSDMLDAVGASKLIAGRTYSQAESQSGSHVALISRGGADQLYGNEQDALGKTISLSGVPYNIIGVLTENADGTEGSGDDVIYIPYENAQRMGTGTMMMGTDEMFLLTSTSRDTASAAKGIVEKRLYKTYQSSDYYMVMTSAEMMDAMNTMMNTMMIVLVAIAAISLLVGGIGIMNIMLVSVTERTREIGIRKSLGAKQKDIRGQFVIEAGTTSAVGGVLGIVFGLLLARAATIAVGAIMSSSMNGITFSAVPTLSDIAVSFGVSVGIGVLFGYLPANKAAKLNPIDALRYD